MERLQKLIASSGVCSRRHAEELILSGKVKVNGVVVSELGSKAEYTDLIEVDGRKLNIERKVYYMLNKPENTITTSSDTHGRNTVIDIFKHVKERVFAVGRLDYDTTGLLLITNDGELSNKLIHPRYEIEKSYIAIVKPCLSQNILDILKKGIYLEDGFAKAKNVEIIKHDKESCTVKITIAIGKKHIVKRMIGYCGGEVMHLHRSSLAFLSLGDLKVGEYRELTKEEVIRLKSL